MKRLMGWFFALGLVATTFAQSRAQDVIYLKKGGIAYTMDIFMPAKPNGAGVIYMVSGGYFSDH